MALSYLNGGDVEAYGVEQATDQIILQASRLVDGALGRPEGLVWTPDSAGLPCYMAGAVPRMSLALSQDIALGANVIATVPNASMAQIGDVLIADAAAPASMEALVVAAVTSTTLTFATVAKAHASGSKLDLGLVIEEETQPSEMGLAHLSRTPLARPLSATYRDGWGQLWSAPIIASGSLYAQIDVFGFGLRPGGLTGRRVRRMPRAAIRYLAGWPATGLPTQIKQATANIATRLMAFPEMVGNIKAMEAGGTRIERFADRLLDAETDALLAPFKPPAFA